jgi:hypothetical protein
MMLDRKTLIIPILLITVGVGDLLTVWGIVPEVDWIWTLGLALAGILAFAIGGFNKVTAAVGPFFILASFLSLLRQTGRLDVNTEVPILVIAAGVLLLVVRAKAIPVPN